MPRGLHDAFCDLLLSDALCQRGHADFDVNLGPGLDRSEPNLQSLGKDLLFSSTGREPYGGDDWMENVLQDADPLVCGLASQILADAELEDRIIMPDWRPESILTIQKTQ